MDTPPSSFHDSSSLSPSSSSPFPLSEADSDYKTGSTESEPDPPFKRRRLSYRSTQVCIACYFRSMKNVGYDFIVSDFDSLRSAAAASIPVRTTFRLKLDDDCITTFVFCVLGSNLFLFESAPSKAVYKIDLLSYCSYGLTKHTVELDRNDLQEARHMFHAKSVDFDAIRTPDGQKILVFSSLIIFRPSSRCKIIGEKAFELYDPRADTWEELPGIRYDWLNYSRQHSRCDYICIRDFTFVGDSIFIQTTTKLMFSLDLGSISQGWQKMDTFFGVDSAPQSVGHFLVIEKKLCVTHWSAYAIKSEGRSSDIFAFPLLPFAYDVRPGRCLVSLVGDDAMDNGKYSFCSLVSGIQKKTGHRQLILNLNGCDLNKYKEDEEKNGDFAKLSKYMIAGDSIKFFLDGKHFRRFYPVSLFSIRI